MLIYFSHLCAHVWTGWIFISDNTSHSNNHVNHYLQIHEHYDACYVQNDFGHIIALSIKSRYQLGWSVLYINKTTLKVIHLFLFVPNTGRVPDGIGGNCKTAIKAEEKFRRHFPAAIDVDDLWLQQNSTAVHSAGTGLFAIRKWIFRFIFFRFLCQQRLRLPFNCNDDKGYCLEQQIFESFSSSTA